MLLKYIFYHYTLFSNYSNFLSISQNSVILVWLERFEGVKFKSEKKKIQKEKIIKGKDFAFLLEQKSKSFVMSIIEKKKLIFFGSIVMSNSLEVIFVKKKRFLPFFAIFWPKHFSHNC